MKEKANETGRKAAKTMWMIYYATSTDRTLQLHEWQNERQWSVNDFRSCMSSN